MTTETTPPKTTASDTTTATPPADASKKAAGAKKPSAAKAPPASSGKELAGYAAAFRDWEPVPVDEGNVEVNPAKIMVIFDVRSHLQPLDEFVKQCAGGITTPICVTQMKYMGESASLPLHPDLKTMVSVKKGETYTILVYGRRRTRAALKLSFKTIAATLKSYKTWQDIVSDAYVENDARADMSTWDRTCHIKNLSDGGMLQDQIALAVAPRISAGSVSQHLGVFDMPEAVVKLFREDLLGVSGIRALRPLRKNEAAVTTLANRAVVKGWTEDEIKEAVKSYQEQQASAPTEGGSGGEKPKKVSKSHDYDKVVIAPVKVADARKTFNYLDTMVRKERAKPEPDPVKVAMAKGRLEGFKLAYGLKEIPAAALAEEAPESAE